MLLCAYLPKECILACQNGHGDGGESYRIRFADDECSARLFYSEGDDFDVYEEEEEEEWEDCD